MPPRRSYAPDSVERTVTLFWMAVDRRSPDECWPWLGYTEKGYGKFSFRGRMRGAHELALEFFSGELRTGALETCHSCNNPICCNPHHLRFDTSKSNVADAIKAGTFPFRPGKITSHQAAEIRERSAAGARGRDLAAAYGLSGGAISMILNGSRWPHAGGPIRPPQRQKADN